MVIQSISHRLSGISEEAATCGLLVIILCYSSANNHLNIAYWRRLGYDATVGMAIMPKIIQLCGDQRKTSRVDRTECGASLEEADQSVKALSYATRYFISGASDSTVNYRQVKVACRRKY